MPRKPQFPRRAIAAALGIVAFVLAGTHTVPAQEKREEFKNLKVLPKDIDPQQLRGMMVGFTRALGVRCTYCHAVQEGQPMTPEALAKDDKPTKDKARAMIEMTRDLNEKYLAKLEHRSDPAIGVTCFTCHHGVAQPRTLQSVLQTAYDQGGLDSTRARYAALRGRYYGGAAYDFGEAPLSDVAQSVGGKGKVADANALHALNVEMNPRSNFASRQYAASSVMMAFGEQGADSGAAVYQRMKTRFGPNAVPEGALNDIGSRLLARDQNPQALAVFRLSTAEHPQSGDAFEGMGEGYLKAGDKKNAIDSFLKAVALDSTNTSAVQKLEALKVSKKTIAKARAGKK